MRTLTQRQREALVDLYIEARQSPLKCDTWGDGATGTHNVVRARWSHPLIGEFEAKRFYSTKPRNFAEANGIRAEEMVERELTNKVLDRIEALIPAIKPTRKRKDLHAKKRPSKPPAPPKMVVIIPKCDACGSERHETASGYTCLDCFGSKIVGKSSLEVRSE